MASTPLVFIKTWLTQLGMEQYVDAFCRNDIDQSVLPDLTDSDLKALGVNSLGHRRKLLAAIQRFAIAPHSPQDTDDLAGEFRQVTVLFADISGFVALSHQLGAEATHRFLTQYFQIVDGIIDRFGGWVNKHIGDNVMGIFGAPEAHKDDPRRAVLAALDIRSAIADLAQQLNQPLGIHIGIASGQVVASRTGSEMYFEYTVTGAAVNLAARLQGIAQTGEIVVDDATGQIVGAGLIATPENTVNIKGLPDPITLWRVTGLNAAQPSPSTTLVGRAAEQQQFGRLLQQCLARARGQTLYVRGEAGIGKSMLVQQFKQQAIAQGLQPHWVEILGFGRGQGDLWRDLTTTLLAVPAESSLATRQAIADRTVQGGDLDESHRVYLNALLDIPQPPHLQVLYELLDNQTRQRETVRTVAHLLAALSQHQPRLLIVEDLHWVDSHTLPYLTLLVQTVAQCPCLLVLTSRLAGDPIEAEWLHSIPPESWSVLMLQPLSSSEARAIAATYPQLSAPFVNSCLQRAEGNPLFLQQLLQAGTTVGEHLPGTLQSVVLARIDTLAVTHKRTIQAAAVLGYRFLLEELEHLLPRSQPNLGDLLAHRLLEQDDRGYRFVHSLIRDGVYDSLLQRDRHKFHRRAATWFERKDSELWAVHLDHADDPQAVVAYEAAAQHYLQQFRYNRALPLVDRGLELAEVSTATYRLTQLKAKIARALGHAEDAIALHRRAAALATAPLDIAQAWIGVAACVRLIGGYEDGLEALRMAKQQVADSKSACELSQIHYFQGCFCYSAGDLEGCLTENTQALVYAQQTKDPELTARALSNLADAYYARCQMHTAFASYDRCLALAQTHGLGQVDIANRAQRGVLYRYLHNFPQAMADIRYTIATARQIGELRTLMYALDTQGEFLTEQGQLDLAHNSLNEALALSERLDNQRYRAYIMQRQARVWIEQGNAQPSQGDQCATARSILEVALAICRATDMRFVAPRVLAQLARVAVKDDERQQFLDEGEAVLNQGCISHNFLWYYYDAMEACLEAKDWPQATIYANALEDYAGQEPFPRSQFWVARCRILVALGQGNDSRQMLNQGQQLYRQAETAGFWLGQRALEGWLQT